VIQRLGNTLRGFLEPLGWDREEEQIEGAFQEGRRVRITIRSAAAELFCLPWDVVSRSSMMGSRRDWRSHRIASPRSTSFVMEASIL
jgi:hypothetical protein